MSPEASSQDRFNATLRNTSIVVIAGVLATTLAQPQQLGRIPIQNLLKNELHVARATNAAFFFWMGLAWYFKPFMGIISDAFPLFGSRRKSYMLLGGVLATLSWVALAFTPHVYSSLLTICVVLNTCMVIASTAIGGYMVEQAQIISGSGRLTAVRNFVQQAGYIVMGLAGGYLASIAFHWTPYACAAVMFSLVPATLLFMREKPVHVDSSELLNNARLKLANIGKAKTMWAAAGLMALFYIAPGLSTATFYRQQNELHMDTQGQGLLVLLGGVGGVSASVAYGFLCRRVNLLKLLVGCMAFATIANLAYLYYTSPMHARVIDTYNGFGYTLAELALMDLAVRSSPIGSEGIAFSLMMSVRNFTLYGSDWFGSKLMDQFHMHWSSLVIANSLTTVLTVPLVFLLPRFLLRTKDADINDSIDIPPIIGSADEIPGVV
jgi:hypothetical protein